MHSVFSCLGDRCLWVVSSLLNCCSLSSRIIFNANLMLYLFYLLTPWAGISCFLWEIHILLNVFLYYEKGIIFLLHIIYLFCFFIAKLVCQCCLFHKHKVGILPQPNILIWDFTTFNKYCYGHFMETWQYTELWPASEKWCHYMRFVTKQESLYAHYIKGYK